MTSRQRIIDTLNHKNTDIMPVDFGGTGTTGINAIVYNGVRRILGIEGRITKIVEVLSQLPEIEPDILDAMGGDSVVLFRQVPCLGLPVIGFKEDVLSDGSLCLTPSNFNPRLNEKGDMVFYKEYIGGDRAHPYKKALGPDEFDKGVPVCVRPKGSHAFSRVYHPLKGVDTVEELKEYAYPEIQQDELDYLEARAKNLYETTDKAICGVFNGNIFELSQLYWGYEDFFVHLMLDDELMDYFYETRMEIMMEDLAKFLKAVGPYIQVIEFTEDFGTQTSLLIAPEIYRQRFKPMHKRMFDYVKKNYPDVKILFHSCGAISELIPDFIDIGIDALNPVQITAKGMEPEFLKREFGKDLVFWGGGIDSQKTLNLATPREVEKEARRLIDIFSKNGGFVFSQVHNVESSVPPENLYSAFMEAKKNR